jgi:hypothetical protein
MVEVVKQRRIRVGLRAVFTVFTVVAAAVWIGVDGWPRFKSYNAAGVYIVNGKPRLLANPSPVRVIFALQGKLAGASVSHGNSFIGMTVLAALYSDCTCDTPVIVLPAQPRSPTAGPSSRG